MTPRPATRRDVIAAVRGLAAGPRFVGIDGFGAAGKTSLARAVAAAVPSCDLVHVDDFARPTVPEWDWARLNREVVRPILSGRPARYRRWDWDADAPGGWGTTGTERIVVIEGVSATRCEVEAPWDLTVWVRAPVAVRRERAVARDGTAMWPTWEQRWIPEELAWLARDRADERADLVVDGTGLAAGTMERP